MNSTRGLICQFAPHFGSNALPKIANSVVATQKMIATPAIQLYLLTLSGKFANDLSPVQLGSLR